MYLWVSDPLESALLLSFTEVSLKRFPARYRTLF